MEATVLSSDGPVISTADLARQCALFEGALGLERRATQALGPEAASRLFAVAGHAATSVRLATPGTDIGVRLVAFDPPPTQTIRPGGVGIQTDALKVVDFFCTDLARARSRLGAFGFDPVGPPALLELPGGERFHELHLRAPDGVMVALIHPLRAQSADYVTVTDRLVSEVQSCSGPVAALEPVRDFYERGLGMPLGLQYRFESESFGRMVGLGRATEVRANNFGRVVEDVMLGVIHYGLPPGFAPSLAATCRAPNRGLVAVELRVRGIDALVAHCQAAGGTVAAPPAEVELAPHGTVRVATVRGPHGVAHLLVERPGP